jgi:hypothetical protein
MEAFRYRFNIYLLWSDTRIRPLKRINSFKTLLIFFVLFLQKRFSFLVEKAIVMFFNFFRAWSLREFFEGLLSFPLLLHSLPFVVDLFEFDLLSGLMAG